MFRLIQNERMKLWSKKGTWIMMILLVLATVCYALLTKSTAYDDVSWQTAEKENITYSKSYLEDTTMTATERQQTEDSIAISQYRLAENIPPIDSVSTEGYLLSTPSFMLLIMLVGVIVAGTIVSSEYQKGTIKMLLTRPVSRAKILTSKLLATFEYALLMALLTFVLNAIFAYVLFDQLGGVNLTMENGQIVHESLWTAISRSFAFELVMVIMSILFSFMISTVTRSSSLAIGLTIFLSMASSIITVFFYKFAFIKYIWLSVMGLESIYEHNHMLNVTVGFACAVHAVYAIIFLAIAYWRFTKSDVTA